MYVCTHCAVRLGDTNYVHSYILYTQCSQQNNSINLISTSEFSYILQGYYVIDMHCEAEETLAHEERPLIATLRRRGHQLYFECAVRPNIDTNRLPFPLIYDNGPSAYLQCSLVITRCAQTL